MYTLVTPMGKLDGVRMTAQEARKDAIRYLVKIGSLKDSEVQIYERRRGYEGTVYRYSSTPHQRLWGYRTKANIIHILNKDGSFRT